MPISDDKATVVAYVNAASRGDLEEVESLLAADGSYWVSGQQSEAAGHRTRDDMMAAMARLCEHVNGAPQLEILTLTAEDGRVSATLKGHMTLKDGRPYENDYHVLATVRDGVIVGLREYYDTALVAHLRSTSPSAES